MQFKDIIEFETWLAAQRQELLATVLLRHGLRLLPVVLEPTNWKQTFESKRSQADIVLALMRAGVTTMCGCFNRRAALSLAAEHAYEHLEMVSPLAADSLKSIEIHAATIAVNDATWGLRRGPFDVSAFASEVSITATESDPELSKEVLNDLEVSPSALFERPLWQIDPSLTLGGDALQTPLLFTDPDFDFFRRWYEGMLRGTPLDWRLQERVALIPDETWTAGIDAVAEEIAKLEALFAVEKALGDLTEERAAARVENRLGIGGNNPPEEIDAVAELQASHTIIWAAVEEIAEEVAADVPDKGRVLRALEALKAGLAVCWRYAGRKTDVLVNAGISAGVGYAVANPQKAQALIDAVKGWLPFFD